MFKVFSLEALGDISIFKINIGDLTLDRNVWTTDLLSRALLSISQLTSDVRFKEAKLHDLIKVYWTQ